MLTKIYQLLLYTFSVEYLSGLAFKPQIIKSSSVELVMQSDTP